MEVNMRIVVKDEVKSGADAKSIFASLLKNRGFGTKKEMEEFLRPPSPTLTYLLDHISVDRGELTKAKKMIEEAIAAGKDICVFGDYDADGITSAAVLWQTLMLISYGSKARVMPFIPDRSRHGYGLSEKAVTDILSGKAFQETAHPDFRPDLVITVDNGIVANASVDILKEKGIVVIITDHHQKSDTVPRCDALIHSIDTSGAGISFLTSLYLTDGNEKVSGLIDLAAIGIVADQMPLVGVNRSIVTAGLRRLSRTGNCGLKAMMKTAGIEGKEMTVYEINYVIAPRINAVGRLDNPIDALRLLCSRDEKVAEQIATAVENHNTRRQELTDAAITAALKVAPAHSIVIAASKEFHEGIIGLVAGKLAEAHGRPAIAMSIGGTVSKGSARSLSGINITALLREHQEMLLGVGGHEMAAGFSIETAKVPDFMEAVFAYGDIHIDPAKLEKEMTVDARISAGEVTMTLAKLIAALEPFGMGNAKPKFVMSDVPVLEDRVIGKNGNHRKLVIEKDGVSRDVIWFNGKAHHPLKEIKNLVFSIEINTWRDRESVQLNALYVET